MDDQRVGGGNVQTRLDDRGGEQHVVLAVIEPCHDVVELGRRQPPVRYRHLHFRHMLAQERGHLVEVGNPRADIEALATAIKLAQQGFADDHRIERRDIGAHRQPVERRRGYQRQLANPRQRQLQGTRDRRGGERQNMHVGAQFLQLLLVLDAEVLLLVNDQQAQVAELHVIGQQRMGTDDDVHVAGSQTRLGLVDFLSAHQPRGLLNPHRQPLEAGREGGEVLARQ